MPGLRSSRICPKISPAQGGSTIGAFSAVFYTSLKLVVDGRTARASMALRRRSITGLIGGRGGEYGSTFSRPLSTRACWYIPLPLIPAMSKPIAVLMAEKGGKKSGYRALAWWSNHENPRVNRPFGPSCGAHSDTGKYQ